MTTISLSRQGDLFRWQKPVVELRDYFWDVVVVGAGPAGSAAAYHLGKSGVKVLLADRARFPRQKVCGDSMITDVDANLGRLGLREAVNRVGNTVNGISIHSPSGVSFDVPGDFVTLRRSEFDALLARNAVEAGVEFVSGHVAEVVIKEDETVAVRFRGNDQEVAARLAIVATGAGLGLAKRLHLKTIPPPSALAIRRYIRSNYRVNKVILSYSRDSLPGYRWIVPLGNDEYNIGCGGFLSDRNKFDIRARFEGFVTSFHPARELVRCGEFVSPPRSAALRCGLNGAEPLAGRSVLLAGEMIGTTFFFTGEGIGQAMTTGWMAAEAVIRALNEGNRNCLGDYISRLEREVRPRHDGFRSAQAWMSRTWLNDLLARRMNRSEYLRRLCADIVNGSGDPRRLYSVRAILKSCFK